MFNFHDFSHYLQLPHRLFCARDASRIGSRGSNHFRPPNGFLKFHKPFFVLISFHKYPGHFYPRESFPLCQRQVFFVVAFRRLSSGLGFFSGFLNFLFQHRYLLTKTFSGLLQSPDFFSQYFLLAGTKEKKKN